MPTYEVTSPDGKTWEVSAPDGATEAQVLDYAKQQWTAQIKPPQASQQAGSKLRDIPRQVGLTARYGIEGLGNLASTFTEPLRHGIVNPALRAVGASPAASLGAGASSLADVLGLPSPQTPDERVVGDATRMLASSMGMGAAAGAPVQIGKFVMQSPVAKLPGVAGNVASQMAARQGMQAAGAGAAGAAGGSVREAGGGPWEQFAAALAGGVAGGAGFGKATDLTQAGARAAKAALTPKTVELQRADQQISMILERSGIDWAQVPERIKQGMRGEVSSALASGQPLNADALRRLLVFRRAGVTPTVGQLTQDPGQITREMNLAKTGANSTDQSLQRLPALQNQNVTALLRQLDEAGAALAGTPADTSRRVIESLDSTAARENSAIGGLYDAARDTAGRSLPLEGGTFTRRASELIDEAMVGGALPVGVQNTLNKIAKGEMPFTVEIAEQIKTQVGKLQRASNDGQARYALGLVRRALDETPLQGSQPVNPGNLPAVNGTVPTSTAAGEQSIAAFNAARAANRQWMQRVEGNPALRAVVEGVEPDQFFQRYVVGNGATAADVRALRNEIGPEAVQTLRQAIVRHLRDAATNNTDDIAKFSSAAYNKALRGLDEKLPTFFSAEEVQQLRDYGNAAKYMQAQPAGSAVNNSNSGALLIGRGLDMLEAVGQKLPVGRDAITGVLQGFQQRQVMAPRNALMLPTQQAESGIPINPLVAGSVLVPEKPRKDKRRN